MKKSGNDKKLAKNLAKALAEVPIIQRHPTAQKIIPAHYARAKRGSVLTAVRLVSAGNCKTVAR